MKPKLSQVQLAMLVAGLLSSGPGAIAADLIDRSPMAMEPAATAGGEATRGTEAAVAVPSARAGASAGTESVPAPVAVAPTTSPAVSGHYVSRVGAQYGDLLGSRENIASLVGGLRNGTPIVFSASGAPPVAAAAFASPAGRMGYGDITQTLNLMAKQLAAAGLDRPTPAQLRAALVGGTIAAAAGQATTLPGILQLRAQGWGWGRIARNLGTPPGLAPAATQAARGSGIVLPAGLRRAPQREDDATPLRRDGEETRPPRVRLSYASRGRAAAAESPAGGAGLVARNDSTYQEAPRLGLSAAGGEGLRGLGLAPDRGYGHKFR